MRISDWSSDVCSSDLRDAGQIRGDVVDAPQHPLTFQRQGVRTQLPGEQQAGAPGLAEREIDAHRRAPQKVVQRRAGRRDFAAQTLAECRTDIDNERTGVRAGAISLAHRYVNARKLLA